MPTPCDMRAPGAASGVFALESRMDELAVALEARSARAAAAQLFGRDQNEEHAVRSKALRECYAQGAERFGWSQAQSGAALDARRQRISSAGAWRPGIWEALTCRSPRASCSRQRPARDRLRHRRHRHRHLHDHDAGRGRRARPAARERHVEIRRFDPAASPVEGGSWTAASVGARRSWRPATRSGRAAAAGAADAELAVRGCRDRRRRPSRRQDRPQAAMPSRAVSIADAMRHGGVDRSKQEKTDRRAE